MLNVYVDPEAPEVSVATVLPPEVKVTVAPAAPLIVPEIEYVNETEVKLTVALPPLSVMLWLGGLKVYPGSEGVRV